MIKSHSTTSKKQKKPPLSSSVNSNSLSSAGESKPTTIRLTSSKSEKDAEAQTSVSSLCTTCNSNLKQEIRKQDIPKFNLLLNNLDYFLAIIPDSSILEGKSIEEIVKLVSQETKSIIQTHDEKKLVSDLRRESTDKDRKISTLESELKDSNYRINDTTNELNKLKSKSYYSGTIQEVEIARSLLEVAQTTLDDIILNDKRHGEDIQITIKDLHGTTCGTIVIESKNTAYAPKHIAQIKKQISNTNALFGILVTTKLPPTALNNNLQVKDGNIWITTPIHAPFVYRALRQIAITISDKTLSSAKMYELLNSDLLKNNLTNIISEASDIKKTKDTAIKQITKQMNHFDTISEEIERLASKTLEDILKTQEVST